MWYLAQPYRCSATKAQSGLVRSECLQCVPNQQRSCWTFSQPESTSFVWKFLLWTNLWLLVVGASSIAHAGTQRWSKVQCQQRWKHCLKLRIKKGVRKALLDLQAWLPHCKNAMYSQRGAEWAEKMGWHDQVINYYQQAIRWSRRSEDREDYQRWLKRSFRRLSHALRQRLQELRPKRFYRKKGTPPPSGFRGWRGGFELEPPVLAQRLNLEKNACHKRQGKAHGKRGLVIKRRASFPKNIKILFDTASHRIRPASRPLLKALSAAIKPLLKRGHCLLIIGHTDTKGKGVYDNLKLSRRRAASVKRMLLRHLSHRLSHRLARFLDTDGMSYLQPVASNKTSWGRQRNRRVEFTLLRPE